MECRFCGGATSLLCELNPMPLASDYRKEPTPDAPRYPVRLCGCACGYVGLDYVIDPKCIYPGQGELTSQSPSLVQHLKEYAESLMPLVPAGATVLDIGANDGTFLTFFKRKNHLALGIEPSAQAVNAARQAGIPTRYSFFDEAVVFPLRSWPLPYLITANRVWANVPDPAVFLENVKRILHPDGLFVIETAYLPDIVENMLVETIYHEHISYDMVHPLVRLCKEHGLVLTHVDHVPIKGGSIRVQIRHRGTPGDTVSLACWQEKTWLQSRPWERFQADLERQRDAISYQIASDAWYPVSGYGAGVPGTALTFQLGLEDKLAWLIDDQPRYWGTYMPGTNLEVRPPESLAESDYCIILAHRYAKQIKEKHPEYDRWLTPFQS